jgi:hypothetical protein
MPELLSLLTQLTQLSNLSALSSVWRRSTGWDHVRPPNAVTNLTSSREVTPTGMGSAKANVISGSVFEAGRFDVPFAGGTMNVTANPDGGMQSGKTLGELA